MDLSPGTTDSAGDTMSIFKRLRRELCRTPANIVPLRTEFRFDGVEPTRPKQHVINVAILQHDVVNDMPTLSG